MRIQPWMTTVASMLLLAAVQTETSGQQPGQAGGMPPGMVAIPGSGGGGPVVHQSPYATNNPQAMYPSGGPQGYQPWPQISPYQSANVAMDQHYTRDGLWFREILHRRRQYFGSIEAMSVMYRDAGNTLVGSPYAVYAPFGGEDGANVLGEAIPFVPGEATESPNFSPAVPGFFAVDRRILAIPALDGGNTFNSQSNSYLYPVRDSGDIGGPSPEFGTQIRWGFDNEDGTGMMLNGFWTFDQSSKARFGAEDINGVPVTQSLTTVLEGQNLFILGVLPLYTGEPIFPEFGAGRTAKFDVLYELEYSTETAGTNLSIYTQPIYKSGGVKVRPLWGARYFYLGEKFRFRGIDSGFTYDIDVGGTNRPDGGLTIVYDQYEALLNSKVRSHMAGPEVGLRFDLGDDRAAFRVWGETIFGLQANHEQITISGDNIGDPLFEARFENAVPRMLDPTVQSEFSDKRSNTHVSPSFQQSIFAEIDAFRNLPLIRNAPMFNETSFRFGYTFFWVGEVARPADAIEWQGFPLFPKVKSDRTSWWMHQLNFAVDWTF